MPLSGFEPATQWSEVQHAHTSGLRHPPTCFVHRRCMINIGDLEKISLSSDRLGDTCMCWIEEWQKCGLVYHIQVHRHQSLSSIQGVESIYLFFLSDDILLISAHAQPRGATWKCNKGIIEICCPCEICRWQRVLPGWVLPGRVLPGWNCSWVRDCEGLRH